MRSWWVRIHPFNGKRLVIKVLVRVLVAVLVQVLAQFTIFHFLFESAGLIILLLLHLVEG